MDKKDMPRLRGQKAKAGTFILTPRDLDWLALVGVTRVCSTPQIAREYFPSLDRARRRIREAYDAGLVRITLAGSTTPNLVSLTPLGRDLVAERLPEIAEQLRLGGAIRLHTVAHMLAAVDARLFAARLGEAIGAPLIEWSDPGGRLHDGRGFREFHLAPDGVAEFSGGVGRPTKDGRPTSIFLGLEVDCGNESLTTLRSKATRYRGALARGLVSELWLVVVGGRRRQENILDVALEAGIGGYTLVVPHEVTTDLKALPTTLLTGVLSSSGSEFLTPLQSLVSEKIGTRVLGIGNQGQEKRRAVNAGAEDA